MLNPILLSPRQPALNRTPHYPVDFIPAQIKIISSFTMSNTVS
jgi:hypothetical protein